MAGTHKAGTDEHQITFFGRQDRIIPIDNEKTAIGIDQEIACVQIGMTQNIRRRASLK